MPFPTLNSYTPIYQTDNQRIYVFNQLGQQIYDIEAFTEMQLNLESLNAGIYYIKYTDKINKINIIK